MEDGQLILSTPDAIGRALETFVNGDSPTLEKKSQFEIAEENLTSGKAGQNGQHCNECDGSGIVNEGG